MRTQANRTPAAGLIVLLIFLTTWYSRAVVTPAADRAFCADSRGSNVVAQMQEEARNPVLTNVVVYIRNNGVTQFDAWTGTLIASNWILTCAHTLQGSDGRGGGVTTNDLFWNYGGSNLDPARAGVAEFIIHTNWQYENYTNGYDIALMRLAVPVTHAVQFPRLCTSPFRAPLPVVFAGFGAQGTGETGETNGSGVMGVGLNTLDAAGGDVTTMGNGDPNNDFVGRTRNAALMDFDKSERREFQCSAGLSVARIAGLSDFSAMGPNELTETLFDPCQVTNPVRGLFETDYCDFLGGTGDSGGPAFLWADAPEPSYLRQPLTIAGVASSIIWNNGGQRSSYGDVGTYTLVQPYLGWIYEHVRELAEQDADGDGQTNEEELGYGTDPYDPNSFGVQAVNAEIKWLFKSNFVTAYELALTDVQVQSVSAVSGGMSEVRFTANITNTGTVTYIQPQATLDTLPYGFSIVAGQGVLLFPDSAPGTILPANNSVVVQVPAGTSTAADLFLANVASLKWRVEGWERAVLGANVLMVDPASWAQAFGWMAMFIGSAILRRAFNRCTKAGWCWRAIMCRHKCVAPCLRRLKSLVC